MTYSEVVHLLSSHLVPRDDQNPQQTIPILEKFVNVGEQAAGIDESSARYEHPNLEEPIEQDTVNFTGNEGQT